MTRYKQSDVNSINRFIGPISRRSVLARAVALGVGVPAVAAASSPFKSVTAQESGVPVIALDGEPNNLHPISATSRVTFTVLDEVNGFLARYDRDFNVLPALALSWETVDDLTWRFQLREGVRFHDGSEMTADDVKFSIEAHLDEARGSGIRARLSAVDRVEADDTYTATIHLTEPYAPLLDVLIDRVPIIPRSVYASPGAAQDSPVGCGPFKFDEWSKNSHIQLSKFEDYWEEGFPKTDGLRFLFLPEYNAAKASLLSKQTDILLQLNPADLPSMEQQDGLVVSAVPLLGFWWIGMDVEREPFTDKRVRQAIKFALNRQEFIDFALGGSGAPAVVPIPKNSPFYSPELEYEPSAEASRQLLEEAGFGDGLSVTLTVPKTPEEEPMGVVLQSQLNAVGIEAELEVLDVPAFIERVFTNRDFELMIVGDTAGPDPAALLNSYYLSDSPSNIQKYSNPEVDELLTEATQIVDVDARRDLYQQALTIALDDSPMVWIAQGERSSAYWDYLDGFINLPTLRYEFWQLEFIRPK
jgi:peptide/nickel transport system substrate-binding protein